MGNVGTMQRAVEATVELRRVRSRVSKDGGTNRGWAPLASTREADG
jgi:hypothetical protein